MWSVLGYWHTTQGYVCDSTKEIISVGKVNAILVASSWVVLGLLSAGCAQNPVAEGWQGRLSNDLLVTHPESSNLPREQQAFGSSVTQSSPYQGRRAATPEAPSILLGEGDVLGFSMFNQPDLDSTVLVSADGSISLPLIDAVLIGGMTPAQAQSRVEAAYRRGDYFRNPQVNITVEENRSRQIAVLGEVNTPGRFPLQTHTTILDALALAEGITPNGSQRVIVIRKTQQGVQRSQVDLNTLVRQTGQATPFALTAGDTVYVPEAELFYIYGEVRRPDAYAVKPGMTVMQALALGGGLTERGSNSRIAIQRKTAEGSQTVEPKLSDAVRPDDVIYVKERFF